MQQHQDFLGLLLDKETKMNQRIIYPNEDGGVSIVTPAECGLTIEEIAKQVVPEGLPFKIVSVEDLPADKTFRDAWEYSA